MRRILVLGIVLGASCALVLTAAALAQSSDPLERVGWMVPSEVSQSDDHASRGPRLVIDSSGELHLLWMENTLGQVDPYYVRSDDIGNTWSIREVITNSPQSYQGSLATGANSVAHACWWEEVSGPPRQYQLLYAKRVAAGWIVHETVVITSSDVQEPSLADAGDSMHVIWSNKLSGHFDLYYSWKMESGGTWTDPTLVTDTLYSSLHARMIADRNGNLHVIWQENTVPNEIMYISGTVGVDHTTWSDAVTVSEQIDPNATSPHIDVGTDGVVHVVFGVDVPGEQHIQEIYHASFPFSNTSGISPTLIPDSRVEISQQLPNYASPSIALDGSGDIHVAWNGRQGDDLWDRIYYAVSHDGAASWSDPLAISADDAYPDGFPAVATDGALIHIAWQQQELISDNDIYYAHSLPMFWNLALGLKGY